jgi:hypothetical protein
MNQVSIANLLASMADKWPSSVIARTEVERFTGGIVSEKYLANLDSEGRGPEGRVRIGRKIVYPVHEFVKWLETRSAIVERKKTIQDE